MTTQELTKWAAQWRGWRRVYDNPDRWEKGGEVRFEHDLEQVATDPAQALALMTDMGLYCDISYLGKGIHPTYTISISQPHEEAIVVSDDSLPYAICEALYTFCARRK